MAYPNDILGLLQQWRDTINTGNLSTAKYVNDEYGVLQNIRDLINTGNASTSQYPATMGGLLANIRDLLNTGNASTASYPVGRYGLWQAIRDFGNTVSASTAQYPASVYGIVQSIVAIAVLGGAGSITGFNFFASDGAQNAVGNIIGSPNAVYYSGRTYIVYQGAQYDQYIVAYVHATGAWEGPYFIDTGKLGSDAHGTPYLHIESNGTGHVVGNCHVTALFYYKFTGGDISTIAVQTSPVASCSYPCIRQISTGTLYLFYRTANHASPWAFKTSTDHGVTWSAATNFLLFGQSTNDSAYAYITLDSADAFHIAWSWEDEGNSLNNTNSQSNVINRYNIYYMKMNTAGTAATKISGGAVGTFPPTLASSATDCLIQSTQSTFAYTNTPLPAVDSSNNPYIICPVVTDPLTGLVHSIRAYWYTGSAITFSVITTTDQLFDEYSLEVVSGSSPATAVLRAYVASGGSSGVAGDYDATQVDRGGNIVEYTSAAGIGSWTTTNTIATAADTTHLYNSPGLVKDYQATAKLVYEDWVNSVTGPYVAKLYLWGSGGKINNPYETETTALLNRFSVTPSTTLQSQINGMIRVMKATGIWAKLDSFWLMGGVDAQSSRLDWTGAHDLTLHGNSGAGPAFAAGAGFTGNGTDSYHDTGILASGLTNFVQNDGEFGLWTNVNAQAAAADFGQAYGTSDCYLRLRDVTTNNTTCRINNITSSLSINTTTDNRNFITARRTSSTAVAEFRNGASITTGSLTSAARDSTAGHTLWVGGVNLGSPQFSARQIGACFIGGSLTTAQEVYLYKLLFSWFRRRGTI